MAAQALSLGPDCEVEGGSEITIKKDAPHHEMESRR